MFNRLNEVEVGDEIVIEMGKTSFNYIVYKISRVKPTDVSVLNRNKKDKILTLITCDPLVNPTHRLIVQAKIVE
ncbi:sortase [Paenibacillus sp. FSL K6-2524]|uniref:sortase n=1 Tax=Paenibacillus sp. FSL K6-2524 TaxID=2954516 RepID=UPI0030FB47E0